MKLKKYNIQQIYVICCIITIHMLLSNIIYAKYHQSIQIHSTHQSLDISTNTMSFTENVLIKYNNTTLQADIVTITNSENGQNLPILKARGNPAKIQYLQKKPNSTLFGQSKTIYYDTSNNIISFIGNASITQAETSIHGDVIKYLINQKKIQANSKETGKTTMILSIHTSLHSS